MAIWVEREIESPEWTTPKAALTIKQLQPIFATIFHYMMLSLRLGIQVQVITQAGYSFFFSIRERKISKSFLDNELL